MLYRFAIAAVVTGSFSIWEAIPKFVATGLGGVVIGLVAGRIIREVRARIDGPAHRDHDLARVRLRGLPAGRGAGPVGCYRGGHRRPVHGWHTPALTTPLMRLQGVAVWEILTFLLNGLLLFLLVGLQLPGILDDPRAPRPVSSVVGPL